MTVRRPARLWFALEILLGVSCEVALELVSGPVLNMSVASGLGLEAAAAVALGLAFGLRRLG
jgi:hypothetical protein